MGDWPYVPCLVVCMKASPQGLSQSFQPGPFPKIDACYSINSEYGGSFFLYAKTASKITSSEATYRIY